MKFSLSRSLTTTVAALTIFCLFSSLANAQSEIGESWFGEAYSRSGSDVQSLYSNNATRPLGGLFAPGFTRTLTVLGGFNFPSASVSDNFAPNFSGAAVPGIASLSFPGNFNRRELDDSGYALSFAFGRRHSRTLRSEIELAFRSNDINRTTGFFSEAIGNFDAVHGETTEKDGRVNATSLMKNFIIDFDNSSRFTPYVGAGLGLSYVDIESGESSSFDGEPTFADGQALFSYQAIGGVATQLNSVADFIVEYRFLGTSEVEFDGLDRELAYNVSNLFMGLKFEY